jgi:hypothetical protein
MSDTNVTGVITVVNIGAEIKNTNIDTNVTPVEINVSLEQGTNINATLTETVITANVVSGARGKSAYDIWLDLGNIGNEEDFIESLQGGSTNHITWANLVTTWSEPPTLIATLLDGVIFSYTYQADTKYRFVPNTYNSFEDAFYEYWDGGILTNLIVRRG